MLIDRDNVLDRKLENKENGKISFGLLSPDARGGLFISFVCSAPNGKKVYDFCLGASNRTNRGAIRPYCRQNVVGVRKDFTSYKAVSFLSYGLNTPLFLHTLHGSRICKKF